MKKKIGIGAKVTFVPFIEDKRPKTVNEIRSSCRKATGTVIYVNAPHKYFTVEFMWHGLKMRESFKFCDLGEAVVIDG